MDRENSRAGYSPPGELSQSKNQSFSEAPYSRSNAMDEEKESVTRANLRALQHTSNFQQINRTSRRLVVDNICLENFKSYEGKQVIGPFNDKFVSVIGPNGSGKSNLLESLLFIFGHRASKMRLKQLKELIHNSANHYGIDKATVSVKFKEIEEDGENKEARIVGTFTISRNVMSETSSSNYEIDGVSKNRSDIVDLLKSKGMDMNNNRFLILQGEVEQISLMKPISGKREDPGLLEYLEDIIGSYKYVDQITELGDSLVEVRKQKETDMLLMHDIGKELENMADSKASAMAFIEIEKKLFCLNHIRYYLELSDAREEEGQLHRAIEQLQADIEADKKKMQETLVIYKEDFMMVKKLDIKKKDNMAKLEVIDQQVKKASEDDQSYHSRIRSILTESHEIETQIKKLDSEILKANDTQAEKERLLPQKTQEAEEVKQVLERLLKLEADILKRIEPQIQMIKQKKEELFEKRAPFERNLKKQEEHKKNMIQELDIIDKREQQLTMEIEKLEKDFNESHKIIEREGKKREAIKEDYEGYKQKIIALQNKIRDLEQMEVTLSQQVKEINAILEERRYKTTAGVQKNQVLMYLMQSKDIQNAGGRIYGRIGDLGEIDPKFDVAISSISPKFNHILCDTMETVGMCIKLLKRDKIGVARFISLDFMQGLREQIERPFTPPPQSVRLFDMVKKKGEVAALAFYYVLKDAICCQTLDIAQQIRDYKNQKHLVVTLEGYIIQIDGSMSGGGKPKTGAVLLAGKANASMSEEEMPTEALMEKKEKLDSALRVAYEEKEGAKKAINQLNIQMQRMPLTIKSHEDSIAQETLNLTNLQKKQQNLEQEKSDGRLQKARKEYQDEIDKIHKNISHTMTELNKLKVQEDELEIKIEDIGGRELKEVKVQVTGYRATHEAAQKLVIELQAQINQTLKNIESKSKEIKELTTKMKQNEEEKTTLVKKKSECEELAKELLEKKKVCKATEKEVEAEYTQIQNKIQDMARSIDSLKQNTRAKKEEQEKAAKQQAGIREESGKINEKLKHNKRTYLNFIANYSVIEEIKNIEKRTNPQVTQEVRIPARSPSRPQLNPILEQFTPDKDLTLEELKDLNLSLDFIKSQIAYHLQQKQSLNGDTEIIESYREKLSTYAQKEAEYRETSSKEQHIRSDLNRLKDDRRIEFMTGFSFISKKLKEVYQTITNGGDADLELIDSLDPFSEGIMFSVRPPHKSWKHMSKLSGGEKTLSSLSLIFALHYYKPTPIYFMDEIDAALDFRNVEIVGKFIKERTKNAQFIVISLRNHMFELASQLIGIYKVNDMTRTISIYPYQFLEQINDDIRKEEEAKKTHSGNHSQLRSQIQSKTSGTMIQENNTAIPKRKSLAPALLSRPSRAPDILSPSPQS